MASCDVQGYLLLRTLILTQHKEDLSVTWVVAGQMLEDLEDSDSTTQIAWVSVDQC